jgi:hypothetical protein
VTDSANILGIDPDEWNDYAAELGYGFGNTLQEALKQKYSTGAMEVTKLV